MSHHRSVFAARRALRRIGFAGRAAVLLALVAPAATARADDADDAAIAARRLAAVEAALDRGDANAAAAALQDAADRLLSIPASRDTERLLDQLHQHAVRLGEIELGLQAAMRRRAFLVSDPDADPLDVASSIGNVGIQLARMGRTEEARACLEEACRALEEVVPEDHPVLAEAWQNLGQCLASLGRRVEGRILLERAIRSHSGDPRRRAASLRARGNLAQLLHDLGDVAGARALEESVLEGFSEVFPPDHPVVAFAHANLARTLQSAGDLDRAAAHLEAARAAMQGFPPDHPARVRLDALDAAILAGRGRHQESAEIAERVFRIRSATLPPYSIDVLDSRLKLAIDRLRAGDGDAAREQLRELLDDVSLRRPPEDSLVRRIRCTLLNAGGSEEDGLGPLLDDAIDAWRRLLTGAETASRREREEVFCSLESEVQGYLTLGLLGALDATRTLEIAEAPRALLHLPVCVAALARRHPELREKQDRFDRAREALAAVVAAAASAGDGSPAPTELAAACEASDRAERALRLAVTELVDRPVDVASTLASRPDGEVVVAYRSFQRARFPADRFDDGSDAWMLAHVVDDEGGVRRFDLGPLAPIEEAADAWRARLLGADGEGVLPASNEDEERLSALVVAPLAAALEGARVVRVVLDGALHRVPLERLVRDALAKTAPIVARAPSLAAPPPPEPRPPGLLALGDPDFDAAGRDTIERVAGALPPTTSGLRRGGPLFAPLEFTRREIDEIGALFQDRFGTKPRPLTGAGATKDALARGAADARYVHLATHGYFGDPSIANRFEWARSPLSTWGASGAGVVVGLAPSQLAGIALAGANRGVDDRWRVPGIATAGELADIDLHGCDLVVLSACETGSGHARTGLGVHSIQSALLAAGARATVASLWRVDDLATRLLMPEFYRRHWGEGAPVAEALRGAAAWLAALPEADARRAAGVAGDVEWSRVVARLRGIDLSNVRDGDGALSTPAPFAHPRHWAGWIVSGDGGLTPPPR